MILIYQIINYSNINDKYFVTNIKAIHPINGSENPNPKFVNALIAAIIKIDIYHKELDKILLITEIIPLIVFVCPFSFIVNFEKLT